MRVCIHANDVAPTIPCSNEPPARQQGRKLRRKRMKKKMYKIRLHDVYYYCYYVKETARRQAPCGYYLPRYFPFRPYRGRDDFYIFIVTRRVLRVRYKIIITPRRTERDVFRCGSENRESHAQYYARDVIF